MAAGTLTTLIAWTPAVTSITLSAPQAHRRRHAAVAARIVRPCRPIRQ
jgi:hypothetical protein